MSLLDHLKKHKKKYLTGLAAGVLAAGTGVGVHKYTKYKQNLEDIKDLKRSRLLSHSIGLSSALVPHIMNSANLLAMAKGQGRKLLSGKTLKPILKHAWHGEHVYQSHNNPNEKYSILSNSNPLNPNDKLIGSNSGLKHNLKHQLKKEVGKFAANKLSDIIVNKLHGEKWNSNKYARKKLTVGNYVNKLIDSHSFIHNTFKGLSDAYNAGKSQK